MTVISALFRWLIEQRYLVANPFAGVRVKGAKAGDTTPSSRAFTEHEWTLIRPTAERLADEVWTTESAARLRFVLDFGYATGLRSGELIRARLHLVASARSTMLRDRRITRLCRTSWRAGCAVQ